MSGSHWRWRWSHQILILLSWSDWSDWLGSTFSAKKDLQRWLHFPLFPPCKKPLFLRLFRGGIVVETESSQRLISTLKWNCILDVSSHLCIIHGWSAPCIVSRRLSHRGSDKRQLPATNWGHGGITTLIRIFAHRYKWKVLFSTSEIHRGLLIIDVANNHIAFALSRRHSDQPIWVEPARDVQTHIKLRHQVIS